MSAHVVASRNERALTRDGKALERLLSVGDASMRGPSEPFRRAGEDDSRDEDGDGHGVL